jgi:hypothetical protein
VGLEAESFTLKGPDFGKPTLAQTYALRTETFSLWTLGLSAPYVAPYVPGVWRIVWCDGNGRPPDIPPDKLPEMIAKMKRRIAELKADKPYKLIGRKDPAVMAYARELAADAGIETSDFTLLKYLIRPAFQSLELES